MARRYQGVRRIIKAYTAPAEYILNGESLGCIDCSFSRWRVTYSLRSCSLAIELESPFQFPALGMGSPWLLEPVTQYANNYVTDSYRILIISDWCFVLCMSTQQKVTLTYFFCHLIVVVLTKLYYSGNQRNYN